VISTSIGVAEGLEAGDDGRRPHAQLGGHAADDSARNRGLTAGSARCWRAASARSGSAGDDPPRWRHPSAEVNTPPRTRGGEGRRMLQSQSASAGECTAFDLRSLAGTVSLAKLQEPRPAAAERSACGTPAELQHRKSNLVCKEVIGFRRDDRPPGRRDEGRRDRSSPGAVCRRDNPCARLRCRWLGASVPVAAL
jgi:hypothetical protein